MSGTRLLVVGGTGFIGSAVVGHGLRLGWTVTSLSSSFSTSMPNDVRHVFADINDFNGLSQALNGSQFDYVVNCCGYVSHPRVFGTEELAEVHGKGLVNLLRCLDKSTLQRYVHISSGDEYGDIKSPACEEDSLLPVTLYGLKHQHSTAILKIAWHEEQFPSVILRSFLIYGPGQKRPRLVPSIIDSACSRKPIVLANPTYVRDFIYIDDFIEAVFLVLSKSNIDGSEVFNICSGEPIRVCDFANALVRKLGFGEISYDACIDRWKSLQYLVGNRTKALTVLGWQPRVSLDEGIASVVRTALGACSVASPLRCKDQHEPERLRQAERSPSITIRLSKSSIGELEKRRVVKVLEEEYLGMGEEVKLFESALTGFFGRPVLCVANGTSALHLALQACAIGYGDEVLVPSLTFVASFQAISATGATPIPCDVFPESGLIDYRDAEKRLSSKTRAIMPVHFAGAVGNLDAVYDFARRNNIRVIEDAAHAFGTKYRERRIGSFGDISCFSFDGIKNITCGEGGCVVTSDPIVLEGVSTARLLGVIKDSEARYSGKRSWEFDVKEQGWRYHMSNIMAAIGNEQFGRFKEFSKKRKQLAKCYVRMLTGQERIRPILHDFDNVVPHIFPIRILDLSDRNGLRASLLSRGIETGIHYQPNHTLSFYRSESTIRLPGVEQLYPELLSLPLHADLNEMDIEFVCSELKELVGRF